MAFRDLVIANRSYRRFKQDEAIDESMLRELVDLARHCPSAANLQSLKYIISNTPEKNDLIFPTLGFAGYLTQWQGPAESEKPSAYIVILGDTEISKNFFVDPGICAQTMLLGATEKGYGGCIFASINRDNLRKNLNIPDKFDILLAIALGKPDEMVVLEAVESGGDIRYYRDENDIHHVPKRGLEDIILDI